MGCRNIFLGLHAGLVHEKLKRGQHVYFMCGARLRTNSKDDRQNQMPRQELADTICTLPLVSCHEVTKFRTLQLCQQEKKATCNGWVGVQRLLAVSHTLLCMGLLDTHL